MLDAEAAVISYLQVLYPTIEISSELPAQAVLPRIRVTRYGGTVDHFGWIDKANIYIEAWGTSKTEAWDLASGSLSSMVSNLANAQFDDGIITFVEPNIGLSWSPDADTYKPRYSYSIVITTHPK